MLKRLKYRRYTKAEALAWLAREKNLSAGQHDAAVCALTEGGASWEEVAGVIGVRVSAVKRRYANDPRLPWSVRDA